MRAGLLVVLTACSFQTNLRGDPDAATDDAIDGSMSEGISELCGGLLTFEPSNVTCTLPAAGAAIVVGMGVNATLDTGARTLTVGGNVVTISSKLVAQAPELLVVVAESVNIAGTLRVIGSRPVAIVAAARIDVTGTINAGGIADANGAGANPPPCGAKPNGATQMIANGDNGGTGGGGGGHRTIGGIGARVPTGGNNVNGGPMNGNTMLVPLRGGCPGGNGGLGNGLGGGGGGGLQLVANVAIQIGATGIVTARGGGGTGTSTDGGGGGGGGLGGSILIEAPTIIIDGKVTAHGGAGGEGSRRTTGFTGAGEDGHTLDTTAAVCTPVSASGGLGGAGGVSATPGPGGEGTNDATDAAGGGGGGGAAGYIKLGVDASPAVSGLVSPPAS